MQNYFSKTQNWLKFDREHLWHPYTSMHAPLPCYPVVSAKRAHLELEDGRLLLDGMSSWWSAIHGYQHPKLNQAVKQQLSKMSHVMFGGIAHQPAAELGARLVDLTPTAFQHVFLADSGSISVEVAMKMALQYWQSIAPTTEIKMPRDKQRFLTIRGGYHGDPFACLSVGDPDNGQHRLFKGMLAQQIFVARPKTAFDEKWQQEDIAEFKRSIELHRHTLAAVIVEPIVQGAGGMYFYHPEYLRQVRALCDEHHVLLLFDEIATGFGRTGELFAMHHAKIEPDIVCLGKALTGGMMTLAATLTTRKIAMGISKGPTPNLMHGPTFMGNPLACATAIASIDVLLGRDDQTTYPGGWQATVKRIEKKLLSLKKLKSHPAVIDARVLGAIGVIQMREPVDVAKLQAAFVEEGVWIRPFGCLIYVMPPYILRDEELDALCGAIQRVIENNY